MIDLLIADTNKRFTQIIQAKLAKLNMLGLVSHDETADRLGQALRNHPSTLMLLGPSWARADRLEEISMVTSAFPNATAMLIADSLSTELMRSAMRAGIKDVLPRAMEDDELRDAIVRGNEIAANNLLQAPILLDVNSPVPEPQGRTIIVMSAKGGVGKSVIAANLAVCLAERPDTDVALLDLDLQYGDVAVMMRLTPKRTVYDVLEHIDDLDNDLVRGFLTRHESGVGVLASPLDPAQAEQISAAHVSRIIQTLKQAVDYLIIDTPTTYDSRLAAAVEASDEVLVVSGLDVPSVKDVKLLLRTLNAAAADVPAPQPRLVVNRSDSEVGLEPEQIVSALDTPIYAAIPSCRQVPLSVNRGIPVVTEFPRAAAARALQALAVRLRGGAVRQDSREGATLVEAR